MLAIAPWQLSPGSRLCSFVPRLSLVRRLCSAHMARSRLIHSAASIIVLTGCAGAGEGDADPLPFFGNLNVGGAQNTGSSGAGPRGNGGAASAIAGGGSGQGTEQTGGATNFGSGNGGSGQNG